MDTTLGTRMHMPLEKYRELSDNPLISTVKTNSFVHTQHWHNDNFHSRQVDGNLRKASLFN